MQRHYEARHCFDLPQSSSTAPHNTGSTASLPFLALQFADPQNRLCRIIALTGPSFGTCRAQENRQNGQSLLWSLLSCCLQCIWGVIEYITKFATIRAAITGEAFFEAGRSVTDLLMRNALKAYGALTLKHDDECCPFS